MVFSFCSCIGPCLSSTKNLYVIQHLSGVSFINVYGKEIDNPKILG